MTLGQFFWLLMVLWLVLGVVRPWWGTSPRPAATTLAGDLLVFLLFGALGWAVFGAPIH
jgi:hypothetical protein